VEHSFADAFAAEFPGLHRYLRRRVGAALAEDLAADTFATAYANWERLDPQRPLRPWLYGIASNLLRHHWRAERRRLQAYARSGLDAAFDDLDATIARADADAQRRELASALAALRGADRELLLLHAWAELTDTEIAAALELPAGTVKSRLHRLRSRLRNRLDPTGQELAEPPLTTDREATR
jgi:RNA polymerase sigma factor (sigma-70 family)